MHSDTNSLLIVLQSSELSVSVLKFLGSYGKNLFDKSGNSLLSIAPKPFKKKLYSYSWSFNVDLFKRRSSKTLLFKFSISVFKT